MDTSKEYIEMCEKAQEIQDLYDFEQRFVKSESHLTYNNKSFTSSFSKVSGIHETVWLPRQDQLQEICLKGKNSTNVRDLSLRFNSFTILELQKRQGEYMSFEKLWLLFTMFSEYMLFWNCTDKCWESTRVATFLNNQP